MEIHFCVNVIVFFMTRITLAHIARKAGVSKATVSRVLNGQAERHKIKPETAHHVLAEAKRLGYSAQRKLYKPKILRTQTWGLVVPDLSHFFLAQLTRTIVAQAREVGSSVLVMDSLEDTRNEVDAIQYLLGQDVDGLLILPVGKEWEHIQQLAQCGIPLVVVDRVVPNIDCHRVCIDNYKATFTAVDYLVERGHRRIGCIQRLPQSWINDERLRGYHDAHRRYGLDVDNSLIMGKLYGQRNGYLETKKLLHLDTPPTAILALSHLVTLGVLRALVEHGLTVPRDMSVIGFDDLPNSEYFAHPITTVTQPVTDMALTAVDLLLDEMNSKTRKPAMHVKFPTTLVRRNSVKIMNRGRFGSFLKEV